MKISLNKVFLWFIVAHIVYNLLAFMKFSFSNYGQVLELKFVYLQ